MKIKLLGSSEKGISLIEAMASILLFSVMVGGILSLAVQNMTAGKRGESSYTAFNLVKSRIEVLKSLPFSSVSLAGESDTLINSVGIPEDTGKYKRTTTITTNYLGDPGLVLLSVSVDYKLKGAFVNHPVTVTSVVSQNA